MLPEDLWWVSYSLVMLQQCCTLRCKVSVNQHAFPPAYQIVKCVHDVDFHQALNRFASLNHMFWNLAFRHCFCHIVAKSWLASCNWCMEETGVPGENRRLNPRHWQHIHLHQVRFEWGHFIITSVSWKMRIHGFCWDMFLIVTTMGKNYSRELKSLSSHVLFN